MAAGLGFKTFATGDVLSAADTNGYLMQGVLVFASAAARNSSITSPQEGQFAYLKDTDVTTYYTGSAWANLDTTGMTNPMTTTGDTIYSSSGSTPARLGIGSTGQVLTVAGGVPSWATPSGGSFTTGAYNNGGQQSTTSTSYTNLATTDALTVTTGTKALVSIVSGIAKTGSATPDSWVSFAVSGATTLAAANNPYGIQFQMGDAVGGSFQIGGTWVVTGLTAGSNTFTMKYKDAGGGTTYFNDRSISVVNLGS
jgi:hypothetical protein